MPTLAPSPILFDPAAHRYTLSDGSDVPSVTRILKETGVSTDFEGLGSMSDRLRQRIDYRRDLGSAVHADIHAADDNDLDWNTVHPAVLPFVEAWLIFREQMGLEPMARERIVYSPALRACGTLDGIFRRGDRVVLVDAKIGDPKDAACHLQTAGYSLLWQADHDDIVITDRWGVRLQPEKRVPYEVFPYDDWTDFEKFRACVTVFYEQATRRGKR